MAMYNMCQGIQLQTIVVIGQVYWLSYFEWTDSHTMRKPILWLVIFGYLAGTATFTGGWIAQAVDLESDLQRLHVIHFTTIIVALMVSMFLFISSLINIEGNRNARCFFHIGMLLMVLSYGLFGATIGINSYLVDNNCVVMSLSEMNSPLSMMSPSSIPLDSSSPCDSKLIAIQFIGAGVASFALLFKILILQQEYHSIVKPADMVFIIRTHGEMMMSSTV